MKKIKKLGTIALSATMLASSIFVAPLANNTVFAAPFSGQYDVEKTITIDKLHSTYQCDENGKVSIPVAKYSGAGSVETKVYPMYSNTEVEKVVVGDNYVFEPNQSNYRIEYEINGVKRSFIIKVELTKPVLSMETNSEVFLPTVSAKDASLVIPFPQIKDAEGNELVNMSGDAYSKEELAVKTTISVFAPNGKQLGATEENADKPIGTIEETNDVYAGAVKYSKFTPKAYGTYLVKYRFKIGNTLETELVREVEIKSNINTQREISFVLSNRIGKPVIGEEFTLPSVNVKDVTNDIENIEAYTKVTVKCVNNGQETVIPSNGLKFTPTIAGDYVVTYEVTDVYGNKARVASYQITNVKDTQAPKDFKLVDSYEFTDENIASMEDVSYKLQTRMLKSTHGDESTYLYLPAVFAQDNDGLNTLDKLIVTREIKSLTAGSPFGNNSVYKVEDAFNQVAKVEIEKEGTYTITYTVMDKENGNKTSYDYRLYVEENTDTVAPEITLDTAIPEYAKAGDVVSFKKPTAIDYRNTDKATGDTRIQLNTYYYSVSTADKVLINADEKDSSRLSFVIPEDYSEETIKIYVVAVDDFGNEKTEEKVIRVINDTSAPNIFNVEDSFFGTAYDQGDEVTLPSITFDDNFINSVNVSIEVVNAYGENVVVTGLTYAPSGSMIVASGAKCRLIRSGEYTVKYILRDGSDNVTIYTNKFTANQTIAPQIFLKAVGDKINAEIGDEVDLNIYTVYDNGAMINQPNVEIQGVAFDAEKKFRPNTVTNDEGIAVKFIYRYDVGGTEHTVEKTIRIIVKDTKKPVVTFNVKPFNNVEYEKNTAINIAKPNVEDNSNSVVNLGIVVKNASGDEIASFSNAEILGTEQLSFTPTSDGTYKVIYTATDINGNEAVDEYSVIVGDKTGPVIELGNEKVNAPTKMTLNSTLELQTNIITIYDAKDGEIDIASNAVTITLKDPEGNKVTNNGSAYSWKMSKVGNYSLVYTARDEAGNTTTITKTIEVAEEVKPDVEKGDVGMVLAIIASLIVLAGVVFFFFKPENKPGKKKK